MEKSKLDTYSLNEEHSRELISRYCRKAGWKYRKMEWDNDIDGEIEVFDDNRETTAKFIKVQLKTIDSSNPFETGESFFNYDASIKFLNFCDVCDAPIILVVYNINEEHGYFIFVQKYICETLDLKNPNWRKNKAKIRLQIPFDNSLNSTGSINELKEIALRGTNLINQLRKKETAKKYYSIISQNDNSHATAMRTSMKILVERSFASSREAMRILLPKINEECKNKIYHRNSIVAKRFGRKSYDVIFLYFYDSIQLSNHGTPFCHTLWIDEKLPSEHSPMVSEPDELIDGINVYWQEVDDISDMIEDHILDKGVYLPYLDKTFSRFSELYEKVLSISNKHSNEHLTFGKYVKKLKRLNKDLDKLNDSFFNFGFPPIECKDLHGKIQSLICGIHNIKVVINDESREEHNVLACIKMYLKSMDTDVIEYNYERKKVN